MDLYMYIVIVRIDDAKSVGFVAVN